MKRFRPAVPHAFIAALTVGMVSIQAVAATEVPSFVEDGKLNVCTAGDYPPMEFYKKPGDSELIGFDIDVANALAKSWNAEVKVVVADFKGLLPSLDSKRCGIVISGVMITPERLKRYDGAPYYTSSKVLLTSASSSDVRTPEDLSGRVVAIEAGTTYESDMAALNESFSKTGRPLATVQTYQATAAIIQQILVGRAAATITQDTTVAYRGAQLPGKLKTPYIFPTSDVYGIYMRKNPVDLQLVIASIDTLKKTGELKKLLNKWNLPETPVGDLAEK